MFALVIPKNSFVCASVTAVYAGLAVFAPGWSAAPTGTRLATVALGGLLIALTMIDWATMRLPDHLTAVVLALGLLEASIYNPETVTIRLAGALAGYISLFAIATVFRRIRGYHGLGLGDAKLLGAAGAWVGLSSLPALLLTASIAALIMVLIARASGWTIGRQTRIPFGPFLALATWLMWLFGSGGL